jgi:beta-ribofuranosylaminobenzene 5'-phosphate synthase
MSRIIGMLRCGEEANRVPQGEQNRPEAVRVSAGARLHLGFLDPGGDLGRRFGSLGLAIDGFETRIEMRRARRLAVRGAEAGRVAALLGSLGEALGVGGGVEVEVASAIPAHAGLGSGTQLALGLALAFRRLHGLTADTQADALALMRGARSGMGIGLFAHGGFMLDAGRGPATALPPIVSHLPFPEPWRVVLLIDDNVEGVHGEVERAAFSALPPFPPGASAEICRHALMQVLPGVAEADFEAFALGISAIQRRLGDHFAPAQGGGRFTSADVGAVAAVLERAGAPGLGQSSWGPTGFVFAPDPQTAAHWAAKAREAAGGRLRVQVHAARAHGAQCVAFP